MSHLVMRRRILLMVLLFAGPLRNAPFGGAQVAIATSPTTGRDRQIPPEWERNWELDPDWDFTGSEDRDSVAPTTSRSLDNFYPFDGGNAPPKTSETEMDNQFGDSYLTPYPALFGRQWHLQHRKQLQVQHKWQSPAPPLAEVKAKRDPANWPPDDEEPPPTHPYAYTLPWKRKEVPDSLRYMPSISAAMTNLGGFFNRLEANLRFAEQSQLGESETRMLEGKHPHPLHLPPVPPDAPEDSEQQQEHDRKTSKLLQALRSYRPSQKIRSLVSRNPQGYRGSQFIDPSYMWLGLGK
ncbi:uncharacterized protein LOC6735182 isoform X2 [Drosophila simulans]|uniref:Uncharacterized protein, isoform C n=1 Tax=Drosophila simulans TaxID=7240 RepID=A0A0J9U5Q4_DROSI|nr:uncharacterized protein LOC6735182 isoform X2 [Drosophila simulans]KMY94950.1 uncharacterized protein Dsimw501_GD11413, isoform C [Drosophila simulans]